MQPRDGRSAARCSIIQPAPPPASGSTGPRRLIRSTASKLSSRGLEDVPALLRRHARVVHQHVAAGRNASRTASTSRVARRRRRRCRACTYEHLGAGRAQARRAAAAASASGRTPTEREVESLAARAPRATPRPMPRVPPVTRATAACVALRSRLLTTARSGSSGTSPSARFCQRLDGPSRRAARPWRLPAASSGTARPHHVPQEQLPLHLEGVVVRPLVGHLLPAVEEVDRRSMSGFQTGRGVAP